MISTIRLLILKPLPWGVYFYNGSIRILKGVLEVSIKYVHTNLIAGDWKSLADFYIQVFGCTTVAPERDISGEWIDKMTGISDA